MAQRLGAEVPRPWPKGHRRNRDWTVEGDGLSPLFSAQVSSSLPPADMPPRNQVGALGWDVGGRERAWTAWGGQEDRGGGLAARWGGPEVLSRRPPRPPGRGALAGSPDAGRGEGVAGAGTFRLGVSGNELAQGATQAYPVYSASCLPCGGGSGFPFQSSLHFGKDLLLGK